MASSLTRGVKCVAKSSSSVSAGWEWLLVLRSSSKRCYAAAKAKASSSSSNGATMRVSSIPSSEKEEDLEDLVPTSGISRPLSEILKELNKKVPDSLIRVRTESDGFPVKYIPWRSLSNGLLFEESTLISQVKLEGSEEEGTIWVVLRESVAEEGLIGAVNMGDGASVEKYEEGGLELAILDSSQFMKCEEMDVLPLESCPPLAVNKHEVGVFLVQCQWEWSGEVRSIMYSADGKSVSVVYRVTLYGTDAEIYKESTGTAPVNDVGYGDPVQKAEAMAFRRACARFGLGLHLYHEDVL
ncbi:unnamed protein product [Camellia sinensis]